MARCLRCWIFVDLKNLKSKAWHRVFDRRSQDGGDVEIEEFLFLGMTNHTFHVHVYPMTVPWDEFGIFTYIDPIRINLSCRQIYQSHGFYVNGLCLQVYPYSLLSVCFVKGILAAPPKATPPQEIAGLMIRVY